MKYANLHLHSVYSDGGFTPQQLVLLAKCLGYGALALTDHETNAGVPELLAAAKIEGMEALPGVEFYASGLGADFHITAIDFNNNDPALNAFIKERVELRTEMTKFAVERALSKGLLSGFCWEDVLNDCLPGSWVCVDQVWTFLKRKGLISRAGDSPELRKAVFKADEVKAVAPPHPDLKQVLTLIRDAGGIAAVAHPYHKTQYVEAMVDMGMNGIEISHPSLREDTHLAVEAAEKYNLYRLGGTDHTGAMSSCSGVHAIQALQGITEEEYQCLKERRLG